MLKISIIIPVYNVLNYLSACIDSVLKQSFSDYEVILVNDGSSDGSGDIVDQYDLKYPERIRVVHQMNKGSGEARNVGLMEASGEYIFFVDSDDTIKPDVLEKLWSAVERTSFPDMLVFSADIVNERGSIIGKVRIKQPYLMPFTIYDNSTVLFDFPCVWNRIVKRSMFIDHGILFPPRTLYEDLLTTPKLLVLAKSIVYADEKPYNYLIRSGSVINNSSNQRHREIAEVFNCLIDFFQQNNIAEAFRDELEFLAVYHFYYGALARIIKNDVSDSMITEQIHDYMKINFPNWEKNPYLPSRRFSERLTIYLVSRRKYWIYLYLIRLNHWS